MEIRCVDQEIRERYEHVQMHITKSCFIRKKDLPAYLKSEEKKKEE